MVCVFGGRVCPVSPPISESALPGTELFNTSPFAVTPPLYWSPAPIVCPASCLTVFSPADDRRLIIRPPMESVFDLFKDGLVETETESTRRAMAAVVTTLTPSLVFPDI